MPDNNEALTFEVEITNPETQAENTVKIAQFIPDKGRGAGNPKLLPVDYTTWTLDTVVGLFGKEKVYKVLVKPRLNQVLANFTSEACTKTEIVDGKEVESVETDPAVIIKDYSEMLRVLSPRGDTVQALSRRLNEIEGVELPDILKALFADDTNAEKMLELKAQAKSLQEERAGIKKSLAEKKQKKASVEDADAEDKQPTAA